VQTSIDRHRWNDVREWVRDPRTRRDWVFAANDGIIATAGLLQGF